MLEARRPAAEGPRRAIRAHIGTFIRRTGPAALALTLSLGATLARALRDKAPGAHDHLLVANADHLTDKLKVGNAAANYLWFDVKMFVTQPYSTSWVDDAGRQYFWNFALKTSLLGDFSFDGAVLADLSEILAALMLVLLAALAVGLGQRKKEDWVADLPMIAVPAVFVASLAGLRMSFPMACANDFRYILPALVPGIYLYVRAVVCFGQQKRSTLAHCSEAAGWSFAAASLTFFALLIMSSK